MKLPFLSARNYLRLRTTDTDDENNKDIPESRSRIRVILSGIGCFIAGALALEGVRIVGALSRAPPPTLELRTMQYSFQYNRSFSQRPSPHTDRAWREMFPLEGGFFVNEQIAPTRATFSAFHQLHCLDNIRKSYWINHDAANNGTKLTDQDVHVDVQPSHVRHCIDLIRQSLMCHADTTLEVVDEAINGVHGFRVMHTCRDWDQLVDWTSQQQLKQHVEQIV